MASFGGDAPPHSLVIALQFPRRPLLLRCAAKDTLLAHIERAASKRVPIPLLQGTHEAVRALWQPLQGALGRRNPSGMTGIGVPLPWPMDRQLRAGVRGPEEERNGVVPVVGPRFETQVNQTGPVGAGTPPGGAATPTVETEEVIGSLDVRAWRAHPMLYDLTDPKEFPEVAGRVGGSIVLEMPVWAEDSRGSAGATWRLWQQLMAASQEELARVAGAEQCSMPLVRRARRALFQRCIAVLPQGRARGSIGVHFGAQAGSKGPPPTAATVIYGRSGLNLPGIEYGHKVEAKDAAAVGKSSHLGAGADAGADPFFAYSPAHGGSAAARAPEGGLSEGGIASSIACGPAAYLGTDDDEDDGRVPSVATAAGSATRAQGAAAAGAFSNG